MSNRWCLVNSAGECLQTRFARHGLPLREHLNSVQLMVSGEYCEGVFPGRWERGRCANLSEIARQICMKLRVFRFVHQSTGAQNCLKICRKLANKFRTILCKYPFSNAPFSEVPRGCVSRHGLLDTIKKRMGHLSKTFLHTQALRKATASGH